MMITGNKYFNYHAKLLSVLPQLLFEIPLNP